MLDHILNLVSDLLNWVAFLTTQLLADWRSEVFRHDVDLFFDMFVQFYFSHLDRFRQKFFGLVRMFDSSFIELFDDLFIFFKPVETIIFEF